MTGAEKGGVLRSGIDAIRVNTRLSLGRESVRPNGFGERGSLRNIGRRSEKMAFPKKINVRIRQGKNERDREYSGIAMERSPEGGRGTREKLVRPLDPRYSGGGN